MAIDRQLGLWTRSAVRCRNELPEGLADPCATCGVHGEIAEISFYREEVAKEMSRLNPTLIGSTPINVGIGLKRDVKFKIKR